MRIHPTQLSQHLQKQLLPLYTVYGEESLLTIEAADMIRSKAHQTGYVEREIFTIDKKSIPLVKKEFFTWLIL